MLINGAIPSEAVVRSIFLYVCQDDDALLPSLTVRETLRFAAGLRLPTWMSKEEKRQRAQSALLKMGLRDCAYNLIGGELVKGINGGEKRRITIGVQSFIHQSRSDLFKYFGNVLLLARGGAPDYAVLFAPLKNDYYAVQTRSGFVQEFAAMYFFGMLQNVAVYPADKSTFYREHDDGAYSVEAFFCQHTVDEVPFEIVTASSSPY
ncbi:abc transporter [Lasallia pustulata]|uniref:Abc transporter n=1 Tax=Lasallia pustulata TaxID=136370 RepID=A0A1W5DDJ9_9LECA|nr:abc transporter [Lasallia pustulata]